MIVIKSIEFMETDRDYVEIMRMRDPHLRVITNDGADIIDTMVLRELIRGRRFVRPDGETLIVGASKQAEKVIGLQYEAWDNMVDDLNHYRTSCNILTNSNVDLKCKLDEYKKAGFIKRLRYLVTGVLVD